MDNIPFFMQVYLAGGFTEDDICEKFEITHLTFRRHFEGNMPLSGSGRAEIRNGTLRNKKRLARLYKTTVSQVYYALAGIALAKDGKADYTQEIKDLHDRGASRADIATLLGVEFNVVSRVLNKPRTNKREAVVNLLATGLYSQEDIAAELNIAQCTVSHYNPVKTHKPNRPRKTEEEWQLILAEDESVSNLARKHNVSRAEIYRRRKNGQ